MEIKNNPAQEQAIHTIEGPVCIVAVPGSGKTTTLTQRIHYMIEECGIDPRRILVMTFSVAAARDMADRYRKMYGTDPGSGYYTIHAFCKAVGDRYIGDRKSVISANEQSGLFFQLLARNKQIQDKAEFIKTLILDISVVKTNLIDPEEYSPACCTDKKLFLWLFDKYEEHKKKTDQIDFDDMLLRARQVLISDPAALMQLQDQYRYLMIDEYQDTSELQKEILYLLARKYENICVVGDDDQSIYRFRGAKSSILLDFKKDFPNAEIIKMGTNYRSCPCIIDAAARLIKANAVRYPKEFLKSRTEEGKIEYKVFSDKSLQDAWVVSSIREKEKTGELLKDMAVLFRTNGQITDIAEHLLEEDIPMFCPDYLENKYTHWMIADLLAYHRVARTMAAGFVQKDDVRYILNRPQRYLNSPRYLNCPFEPNALIEVSSKINTFSNAWKHGKAIESIEDLFICLHRMADAPPVKSMLEMENVIGYRDYIKQQADFRNLDADQLLSWWESYKKDAERCGDTWESFEDFRNLYTDRIRNKTRNPEGVVLSTLHRSKGLEYDTVIIPNCIYGTYPFVKAESAEELEEERRLFYVGMTRAKNNLYLCSFTGTESVNKKGKKKEKIRPSQYMAEIGLVPDLQDVQLCLPGMETQEEPTDLTKTLADLLSF